MKSLRRTEGRYEGGSGEDSISAPRGSRLSCWRGRKGKFQAEKRQPTGPGESQNTKNNQDSRYLDPKLALSCCLVAAPPVSLRVHRPAARRADASVGVGVAIVSYNTTYQTLRCLKSLRLLTMAPDWVLVLDNASRTDDLIRAIKVMPPYEVSDLRLYHSAVNLGFAEGCNRLIELLLAEPRCNAVILLNNDAVAMPCLVACLTQAVMGPVVGLAGGRMHKLDAPDQVDTLGITLYASLMPADRRALSDPYLGPTGGCAILTRACLEDLRHSAGYWFDPRFFCYCEDTDLVIRAILLGYQPRFVDELLALHEGQASSGVEGTHFIAYQGLRNSVWMLAKSVPWTLLIKYGPLLLLAHGLTIARHMLGGNARLVLAVYRDALWALPDVVRERRRLLPRARAGAPALEVRIASRFYRAGYVKLVLEQLGALYRLKWR